MTIQEWKSINTLTTRALIKLMVKKVTILSTDVSNTVNIAFKNLGKLSFTGKNKGILKNLKYELLV